MKQIFAKFTSKCAETGRTLKKGDLIFYDYTTRKAYHANALTVKQWKEQEEQDSERRNIQGYVEAQEAAYWDRLSSY